MASVAKLYTSEILGLATELALMPFDPVMPLHGHARSPSCGSTLALSLAIDATGRVTAGGVRAQACAIGQASAAIFLRALPGRQASAIPALHSALTDWLAGQGPMPEWPGLETLAPAVDYPARHGAMLLPWNAALDALSQSGIAR